MDDVIIVGAGYAGLAAARMLHDQQQRVLICEARDRIGGRVWSTPHDGYPLELGAEWVHGDTVSTWQWIHHLGLETQAAKLWQGRRVWYEGALYHPDALRQQVPMIERLTVLEDEIVAYTGPDIAFADWLDQQGYTDALVRHLADIRLVHSAATTPQRASISAIRDEILANHDIGGDDHHIVQGYAPITQALATGLNIALNHVVTHIHDAGTHCEVTLADGRVLKSARVIVTIPLALLKDGVVTFTPALPDTKQAAIAALDMHNGAKVVMRFREPFWDTTANFMSLFDPAPVWWTMAPDAPYLLGFFTGPRADALRDHPHPQEMCLEVLSQVFGDAPRQLLEHCQVMIWGDEPWSRGAYSSTPVGAFGARIELGKPHGRIHFAGEATALDGQAASVHGAIVSGQRAAHEILQGTHE